MMIVKMLIVHILCLPRIFTRKHNSLIKDGSYEEARVTHNLQLNKLKSAAKNKWLTNKQLTNT